MVSYEKIYWFPLAFGSTLIRRGMEKGYSRSLDPTVAPQALKPRFSVLTKLGNCHSHVCSYKLIRTILIIKDFACMTNSIQHAR